MKQQTLPLLMVVGLWCHFASRGESAEDVDYVRDVKPVLAARCYACHGALKQEGGLRLDTAKSAARGGTGGAALKAGDASASPIIQRVLSDDEELRMPREGEKLKPEQVAALRKWIDQGAKAPADEQPERDPREHWAFKQVVRPAVPVPAARNPIDAFVNREHQRLGLVATDEAPRSTLVRRLYLDLIGLPPSATELAVLDADRSDDWYDRLVTRLLADPRHGERWARHWMDIWRYSDWWGLGDQLRNSQYHIWHWRDWIVESLNADTPYDEMVRLMLAADELRPDDLQQLRATGFLARNYFLFNRNQWMDETVEHVSKGFLGLTMNCAKCHDHKYDPFDQVDFYRLRAIFEPYHVRLDVVPGEADLMRDGIPRVFDGLPDLPTYLFVRGQEGQPDKSKAIQPAVPPLLAFKPLEIKPVDLPPSAWQPERREWVLDAHLLAAKKAAEKAATSVAPAKDKLAAAKKLESELAAAAAVAPKEPPKVPTPPAEKPPGEKPSAEKSVGDAPAANNSMKLVDRFETPDTKRWKQFGGEWTHAPGKLQQKRDGAERAGLRMIADAPRNFDATVRFTILGGSRWRSVSLCFDSTQADPAAAPAAGDSEQSVYISAVSGGSKIQASYHQGGAWKYPTEAMRAMPIELNREYTLRVQVRDTLINAWLNGEFLLAWRTPLARRPGALQLTTFDALTSFAEFTLEPLPAGVMLREPSAVATASGAPNAKPTTVEAARAAVKDAEWELQAVELALATAQAEVASLTARGAALRESWSTTGAAPTQGGDAKDAKPSELTVAAVKAERGVAAAKARQALVAAELKLHRAAADKKSAVEAEVKTARDALAKAEAAIQAEVAPTEKVTSYVGAKWTPTRFASSGADDPQVKFHPQSTGRRKALAEWITDRRNPLAARVAVNQIWARHMGTPLVTTVFDFGRKGSPPSHPELLDWLAAELMENGWSMRHLHRLIVTSEAYRRSSSAAGREANLAKDAENRYLWRRSPARLESQVVRDSILSLAGTLDVTLGGPPVPAAQQADSRRRSLYFFHSNNERNLFLTTFDEATVKECYRRDQSIVPQQALALTNSRLVLESSSQIAARIAGGASDSPDADREFARRAFLQVLGITAGDAELGPSVKALEQWRAIPNSPPQEARSNLVWVLLNHSDFVTQR